ncbi:MAG TPA: methyltransferase domain-containing protein, partial [Egibacteraceae bacterium]|nr:methyltransferase domain-containing protein [Egibacteraceae bacterium]
MTDGLDRLREAQRRTWAAGDYAEVGKNLVPASEAVVARAGIGPGMAVLDVATGTGNAALLAAGAGADVTGVDFTPGLLEVARERARGAGLDAEFV